MRQQAVQLRGPRTEQTGCLAQSKVEIADQVFDFLDSLLSVANLFDGVLLRSSHAV
jgi:hypothetical protein